MTDRGTDRGRGRRELRRPVGQGRRPPVRRRRPPALGRALLRGHRGHRRVSTRTCPSCATPTATPTSRRRSAVSSSAGSSPRRSRGSPRTRCPTRSSSSSSTRTGTTSACSWSQRPAPDPRAAPHRDLKKFYNGPESFTPDNQFILGEAPGLRRLLRRRRVQLGRHRLGRRRRPGPGRVDRRGRADQRSRGRRHPALRPVQRQQPVAARPGGRGPRACTTRCPWPNRELATARPFRRSPLHHLLGRPRAPCSVRRWAGSGRTSSPRRARSPSSTTPGASRTGWPGRSASSGATRERRGRVRRDLVRQAAGGRSGRRGGAPAPVHGRRRRGQPGGPSTPGCSTSAPATRPT